jgi:hypothetical protein
MAEWTARSLQGGRGKCESEPKVWGPDDRASGSRWPLARNSRQPRQRLSRTLTAESVRCVLVDRIRDRRRGGNTLGFQSVSAPFATLYPLFVMRVRRDAHASSASRFSLS